jgi:hypothetical protein
MTDEQGLAIGILVLIGYGGWLITVWYLVLVPYFKKKANGNNTTQNRHDFINKLPK